MSNGATAFGDYNSNGAGALLRAGSVGLTDCGVLDPIWPYRLYHRWSGLHVIKRHARGRGNTRILRAEAGTAVSYHMDRKTVRRWNPG